MEIRVTALKNNFNNSNIIRNNVKEIFDFLQIRMDKLKFFYSDFIKNNKTELFIFGLDSFHFQSRLIDIEYEGMYKIFRSINNRMYCEYFKLYKIIVSYIKNTINDKKLLEIIKVNNFPIYKDLEPEKEYKFEIIIDLHEHILILITSIIGTLNNKENEYKLYVDKNEIGLNIDNFVNTYSFDVIMMREKLKLFLTYIEFFHKLHTKYFQRFANKIQLMYSHINDDIRFDENVKMNKNNITIETKNSENLNSLLSTKTPGFLKKGFDSVNYLFSGVTRNNDNDIGGIILNKHDDNNSLQNNNLNTENINNVFSNIDSICNNVINKSNLDEKEVELFFENPTINSDENNNVIEDNIDEKLGESVSVVENVSVVIEDPANKQEQHISNIIDNDDVSVLSLDSTIYEKCNENEEEEEENVKEENVKEENVKEETTTEEPKKKRVYKPRKKK